MVDIMLEVTPKAIVSFFVYKHGRATDHRSTALITLSNAMHVTHTYGATSQQVTSYGIVLHGAIELLLRAIYL
jgi:hypothetical protein